MKKELGRLNRKQARELLDTIGDRHRLPRVNRSLIINTLGRSLFISNTGNSFLLEEITANQKVP
jgi:hypothetical protein